ncbi:TPA: NAD-dependent epimerase/dehydratase family protein [Vibrio vulnificus]|nr:NAD-dependent epimerase/dehydratase family protein [Vibrio vulnificus]HDY7474195.1 NAD-dependent epimerase/dehydratase family protein [Vibrio vulnificus]HDY8121129.1 NAD-dependent epimerase/dehydratase family protein [Vibrio vulnificus]
MGILLTGSTGFIGKQFVESYNCLSALYAVVRHNSCKAASRDVTGFFVVENGINSFTPWDNAFSNIRVVLHLGGLAHKNSLCPSDYDEVNVEGTLHLARSAAKSGVQRFIFVSSIGVNGISTNDSSFTSMSPPCPHNSYSRSKYKAELGLKRIAEETGLEVVIVRPTLVYGPNAPGNFGTLTKLVNKLPFLPFGLATNRRDFISVQNLADLLVTCVTHPDAAGHTFLASDGETVSIKEFTNAIAKGLDKKIFQLPVPVTLMRLAGKLTGKSAMIEQLYGNLEVDSSHIKEVLGWTPPFTMEQSMAFLKHTDK